jgi:hypothetical protein
MAHRFNSTTKMSAIYAKVRKPDPPVLPLENSCAAVFMKLDPPGISFDDARGLLGKKGYMLDMIESGGRGCVASFTNIDKATEILEFLRSKTNLVVNFARWDPLQKSPPTPAPAPAPTPTPSVPPSTSSAPAPIEPSTNQPLSIKPAYSPVKASAPVNTTINPTPSASSVAKEWAGVRLMEPPVGVNARELFGREAGFLYLLFESDGTHVALYETETDASAAMAAVRRLVVSEVELAYGSIPRKLNPPRGSVDDPTSTLCIELGNGVLEGMIKALMKGYDGYIESKTEWYSGSSGALNTVISSEICYIRFGSIAKAKKAMCVCSSAFYFENILTELRI